MRDFLEKHGSKAMTVLSLIIVAIGCWALFAGMTMAQLLGLLMIFYAYVSYRHYEEARKAVAARRGYEAALRALSEGGGGSVSTRKNS